MVDAGVDIVVAQGVEAGGHVWGKVATMALTPAVVDAVPGTPVVAAGGIADGRGLAAVMALGAEAAWVGTRLLLAAENDAHPAYRAEGRRGAGDRYRPFGGFRWRLGNRAAPLPGQRDPARLACCR